MITIGLVIQQGFGARILLQTRVLDTLIGAGARVLVLTSDPDAVKRYLDARGMTSVCVEALKLDGYRKPPGAGFFKHLRQYGVRCRTVDDLFEMAFRDALKRKRLLLVCRLAVTRFVSRLMHLFPRVARFFVGLENRMVLPDVHRNFYRTYRPDVMVFTSMGTFDDDHLLMREAKRNHAQIAAYVLSWDNTTVRGLGVNLSDRIMVWSDVMKNELIRLHRISPQKVTVTGVPHYDHYLENPSSLMDKPELGRLFGFDPAKRLLFLGTKSPNTFLYNPDIARVICESIRGGRLPGNCHLVVRLHPIYLRRKHGKPQFETEMIEWEDLQAEYGGVCLTVDTPAAYDGNLNFFMPDDEIIKLGSLLKHSAVVINMFSTLNIEASIFDVPTVNAAFQFHHKRPPGDKMARFDLTYDEIQTHNQRIIRSGGTVVVHSAEKMIENIQYYLKNPTLCAGGRKRIVNSECRTNLGSAGKAVGETILELAGAAKTGDCLSA